MDGQSKEPRGVARTAVVKSLRTCRRRVPRIEFRDPSEGRRSAARGALVQAPGGAVPRSGGGASEAAGTARRHIGSAVDPIRHGAREISKVSSKREGSRLLPGQGPYLLVRHSPSCYSCRNPP